MDEVLAEAGPFRDGSIDPIGAYLAMHDIDRAELNPLWTMRDLCELTHFRSQLRIADRRSLLYLSVTLADWGKLARACRLLEHQVLTTLANTARELPDHISAACNQAIAEGLDQAVVVSLMSQLIAHVHERRI